MNTPNQYVRFRVMMIALAVSAPFVQGQESSKVLRAGAAAIDITPEKLPVVVSGSMFLRTSHKVVDRLHAKCLVLDDGQERIALVVIDLTIIPRETLDKVKQLAHEATGIPLDRMLMSATHTHSAPGLDGHIGSNHNPEYRAWLPGRIAEAVKAAVANSAPARIGWTVIQDAEHTHSRRWIRRPDRIDLDPFGHRTVRAMMHPGHRNPDYLGPSGPIDPDISIVSVQSSAGKPIALLANYAMHYVGAEPISADYYGAFGEKVAEMLGAKDSQPAFVGIMSQGTSGDLQWMDYAKPRPKPRPTHTGYAEIIARQVADACKKIEYRDRLPITMREKTLTLNIRTIPEEDVQKAKEQFASMQGRAPKTKPEVYARHQVLLSERPSTRELKLQALNIGGLGIIAIPCEVFALTGLKLKALSPLESTFTMELANGCNGYLPPPAQHAIGGYTTWRSTTSCLEVQAEPKIVEQVLGLLEEVSGKPRRKPSGDDYPLGTYPQAVLASKPMAYWRLNEFNEPQAVDASGNEHHGVFEPGVVFYLEGPGTAASGDLKRINRSPQFAGGRMKAHLTGIGDRYSVEMWFSNYLPTGARQITGYLFAQNVAGIAGDCLGIAGAGADAGKLFFAGEQGGQTLMGKSAVGLKTWNHVVLVRDGGKVTVYLNGQPTGEIVGEVSPAVSSERQDVFIGGNSDRATTFEGRIDEVAIYGRPLTAEEVTKHYQAADLVLVKQVNTIE